jgi:maltose O-acetyltransferase
VSELDWKPSRHGEPDPRWRTEFSVASRRWAFLVNKLAASPMVKQRDRARILRRLGLQLETDLIFPECYFHTANIWLGPRAILNHGVHIENMERVEIGAMTGLGIFSRVITSTHDLGPHESRLGEWHQLPVIIGAGCWIGAGAIILPGVTIGDGCIIAAGAVVRDDCEPDGVYAGVPARRIRDLPP